jgi:hypothetical protein
MNLVTIATSFDLAEAGLSCSRLAAAGFHPVLGNENTWLGGTMSTAALLRIQVSEAEANEAKEFLAAPAE